MDNTQRLLSDHFWTKEETEAFIESLTNGTNIDGINEEGGIFSGAVASNGYPNARQIQVNITSIVPPAQGWPIVAHCDICKKTFIVLSPWAVKPEDGDYWKMNGTCLDEEIAIKHNMYPQNTYPWKEAK